MGAALIADIGGTSSRFALAEGGRPVGIFHVHDDDLETPEQLITRALDQLKLEVREAVLAVAGPVDPEGIQMTNRQWWFGRAQLMQRFGLTRLVLLNDFQAIGYALAGIPADDLLPLWTGESSAGPKLAIGPGTGLGAALYVPVDRRVLATEAGHMSFGPASADEFEVLARLHARHGYLSAEAVLAGPGLPRLHAALHGESGGRSPEEIGSMIADGERDARATMACYTRLLGRFAGDLALAFRADGGVFLTGGVARRLGPFLDPAALRAAFVEHPPYQGWLERVPIHLITAEEPGLIGCAIVAAMPH